MALLVVAPRLVSEGAIASGCRDRPAALFFRLSALQRRLRMV